jgi:hypothetical protein
MVAVVAVRARKTRKTKTSLSPSYLWPNFGPNTCSRDCVLSLMFLLNEKFRERASVWVFVNQERDKVSLLFSTLCNAHWLREHSLTLIEWTALARFLVGCFQALSHELVRVELLKVCLS